MSTRKDYRVVEMDFDNRNFEKNAQQSISTLDKLKKALNFDGVSSSFNNIENAVKIVNLEPLIKSVDQVKERFSGLGVMGMNVMKRISDSAIDAGKKIWDNTLGQIKSGGSARALNIANSQFKLEGLGIAWKEASKDISQAVDGTAYGFDAAANTAAQLATAGIELGESYGGMAHALRAVSGIAAMTNSSYEEIGYIFSQIASAGKLMGQDAMQISTRGINVTATLAKQLNKTTDEISEMQRKGEISFAMFAEAMNDAFGDQATKANETFQGAMSNVKSSLSRIGEVFYGPFYDAMITPLNKIREAFNRLKAIMDDGDETTRDFKDRLTDILKTASNLFSYFTNKVNFTVFDGIIDRLNVVMESLIHVGNIWERFLGITKKTDDASTSLDSMKKSLSDISDEELELAKRVVAGEFGNGEEQVNRLKELTDNYELVQEAVNKCAEASWDWSAVEAEINKETKETATENERLTDIFRDLGQVFSKTFESIKNVGGIFKEVFFEVLDSFGETFDLKRVSTDLVSFADTIDDTTEKISEFIKNNPQVRENLNVAVRVINNLYIALRSIIGSLGIIFNKYIKSFITTFDFAKIRTDIYSLSRTLATFFNNLFNFIKNDDKLEKSFDKTFEVINNLYRMISAVGSILIELLRSIGVVAVDSFGDIGEGGNTIVDITDKIATWIEGLRDYIKENDSFITAIRNLIEFFKNLPEKIGTAIDSINDKFKELTGIDLKTAFSELSQSVSDKFDKLSEKIHEYGGLFDYIKSVVDEVKEKGILQSVKDFFSGLFESGGGVDEAQTDMDKVLKLVGTIAGIIGAVVGIIKAISIIRKLLSSPAATVIGASGDDSSNDIKKPTDLLRVYRVIVGGVRGLLNSISQITTGIKTLITDLKKFVMTLNIAVVAGSILMLAIAAKKLSDIKIEDLGKAIIAIAILLQMLGHTMKEFMKYMSWIDEDVLVDFAKSLAIIVLSIAASIYILSKAMQNIATITDTSTMLYAWGSIVSFIYIMVDSVKRIGAIPNLEKISDDIALVIIGMSAGIYILSKAITKLAQLPIANLVVSTLAVAALIEMYALVMLQMSTAASKFNYETKDIYAMAVSMVAFGISIKLMASAITAIGELNMGLQTAGIAVGSLMALVVSYVGAIYFIEKANASVDTILAFSAGIYIFSKTIKVIAESLIALSAVDTKSLWNSVGALVSVVAVIAIAIGALAYINASSAESVVAVCLGIAAVLVSIGLMMMTASIGIGVAAKLISEGIERVAKSLILLSVADLSGLKKNAKYIGEFVKTTVTSLVEALAENVVLITSSINAILNTILESLAETLPDIFDPLGELLLTALTVIIKNMFGTIAVIVVEAVTAVVDILEALLSEDGEGQTLLGRLVDLIISAFLVVIDTLSARANEVAESVVTFIINVINAIADALRNHSDEIAAAVENWYDAIFTVAESLYEKIKEVGKTAAGKLLEGIKEKATDAYNDIKDWVDKRIQNFKDAFGITNEDGKFSKLWKIGKGIIEAWINGIKYMATEAYNAGSDFFNDFLDGLKTAFSDVTGWLTSAGTTILDTFKNALKENSPSKATEEDGVNLLEGLKRGLKDKVAESGLLTDIKGLGKSVLNTFSDSVDLDSWKDKLGGGFDIQSILGDIDVENPTITPILDTSNLTSGMDAFNSDYGTMDYSLGLDTSSNLASSIGYSSDYSSLASSSNSASEINALRNDVKAITEKMSRLEVRLDTGALVGGLYAGIDEKLGEQQILAGRGVIT